MPPRNANVCVFMCRVNLNANGYFSMIITAQKNSTFAFDEYSKILLSNTYYVDTFSLHLPGRFFSFFMHHTHLYNQAISISPLLTATNFPTKKMRKKKHDSKIANAIKKCRKKKNNHNVDWLLQIGNELGRSKPGYTSTSNANKQKAKTKLKYIQILMQTARWC